jgi:hypothetical protein
MKMQFSEDEQNEILKIFFRFTTVYSSDFKKCETNEFFRLISDLSIQMVQSTTCTNYFFLAHIWTQLRDSECVFFVEQLEKFKILLEKFIDLKNDNLEILFLEEVNTYEQVLPLLGKLLRSGNFTFSVQMLYKRLQNSQNRIEIAWTIALYSAMLSHRIAYQASEEHDQNDGFMSGNIFQFVLFKDYKQLANEEDIVLEASILDFFENFKQTFLINDGSSCQKMWETLTQNCTITKQEDVIVVFLGRALYYLKESNAEQLVVKSADLFQYLVNGVHTCKILQTPEIMQLIEESGIYSLHLNCSYQKSKTIMKLFESIGRLFFSHQFNESPEKNLGRLLTPICEYFIAFASNGEFGNMDTIVRQLRGILSAIYTSKLFKSFFDCFSPYIPVLVLFLNSSMPNGPFNTLKLIRDMATNKVNRLVFDTDQEYGFII